MISNLKRVAQKIAAERKIDWHSGMESKFWKLNHDTEKNVITKEDAIKRAAEELGIKKTYDKHYKELESSIK